MYRHLRLIAAVTGALFAPTAALAVEPPALPSAIVPVRQVATFPPGTFLENLVVAADGSVYFTNLFGKQVLRYRPGAGVSVVARTTFYPAGIAFFPNGDLLVAGATYALTDPRKFTAQRIYRITPVGTVTRLATVPHDAFLNGIEPLRDGTFLIADSVAGVIRRFDPATHRLSIWLAGNFLRPKPSPVFIPGANGIKILGNVAYISNSAREEMIAIQLDRRQQPGTRTVVLRDYSVDDFIFGPAGRLYVTTHGDHVVAIDRAGQGRIIAGPLQGVLGSTALAYGRTAADRTSLYALSDGGTFVSMFFTHKPPVAAHLTLLRVGAADPRRP